jgi:hypothetical protein
VPGEDIDDGSTGESCPLPVESWGTGLQIA